MQAFDFLVIGSGSAGLTFAISACASGRVGVITKKERSVSNTNWAQGGIAGVFGEDDDPELHYADTLTAGAGLCDEDAVRILVNEGPERIRELMAFGARFNVDGSGRLSLGREGGHSRRRIVHSADLTGREVERTLIDAVRAHPNIAIFEHHSAVDLIVEDDVCLGAYVLDEATGGVEPCSAKAVLLATGGCGQIYQHTTNPSIATGDGLAMAWRAGATVSNMEFVQFHPTSLFHPRARSFLISEAVRGEGGVLRRPDGTEFMQEYDDRKDLAPRDIVARAIDSEMTKTAAPCVYLDITHKAPEEVRSHFPNIYARCLTYGIDITTDWIPVVPAAHYSCGGVKTDLYGRTGIPRLYACGEVACTGVHGANRLASNSLLEALVFSRRAAQDCLDRVGGWDLPKRIPAFSSDALFLDATQSEEPDVRLRLRQVMQRFVGIVRSDHRLARATDALNALADEAQGIFADGHITDQRLELRNMTQAAQLIVRSATMRKESRGLHFTTDYPTTVESERHDTLLTGFRHR